jgi:hypothetical protein
MVLVFGLVFAPKVLAYVTNIFDGVTVNWENNCNSDVVGSGCGGQNVAKTHVVLSNTSKVAKSFMVQSYTYSCDDGTNVTSCSDNGKMVASKTVTLAAGQKMTDLGWLTQSTPNQQNCGSAQVDFVLVDQANGMKSAAFWGLAYTGNDCKPPAMACPPVAGGNLNGQTYSVGYADGLHWIVGNKKLQKGADYVYYTGAKNSPENTVVQCFYPTPKTGSGIQTNWRVYDGHSSTSGFTLENGADFGLYAVPYLARNIGFNTK